MRERFWAAAHRIYHNKKPSRWAEAAMMVWGIFFLLVYISALFSGWKPDLVEAIIGLFLTFVPLTAGAMHLVVRVEASKGSDALYRKLLAVRR